MNDQFYRALEDRFRGSRETILDRQRIYLPFIKCLKTHFESTIGIDLGCGRGEWLELLVKEGIDAIGCDLDGGMLEACELLGVKTIKIDAIKFLQSLPDNHAVLISAFHLVEHIPFDQLRILITEAHRVLKPGGLLLMETPNPENVDVGTNSFYLDPTHRNPLPPSLLGFLSDYSGFVRHTTLRLQESPSLIHEQSPQLFDVLTGVSPDYAIVGQKSAPLSLTCHFDDLFNQKFGLQLSELTGRYDRWWQRELHRVEHDAHQLAKDALERFHEHDARIKNLELLKETLLRQQDELNLIYSSRSWKYMSPFRWLNSQWAQLCKEGVLGRAKTVTAKIISKILPRIIHRINKHSYLKRIIIICTRRLKIYDALHYLYRNPIDNDKVINDQLTFRKFESHANTLPTPGARNFHGQLSQAINNIRNK